MVHLLVLSHESKNYPRFFGSFYEEKKRRKKNRKKTSGTIVTV